MCNPLLLDGGVSPEHDEATDPATAIADAVEIRDLTIDDFANVRALHAISQRADACEHHDAIVAAIYADKYTQALLRARLVVAWLDGRLIGTAGWLKTVDRNAIARIEYVHVDPLFTRLGIGRRLVRHVEAAARQAGFEQFSARPTFNAVAFFEHLGYRSTSLGVRTVSHDVSVPVAHMRRGDDRVKVPLPGRLQIARPRTSAALQAEFDRLAAMPTANLRAN